MGRLMVIAVFWVAATSFAETRGWQIHPVAIESSRSGAIWARFEEPCTGAFEGFLVRQNAGHTSINAIMRIPRLGCAGLPEIRTVRVPLLQRQSIKSIRSAHPLTQKGPFVTNMIDEVRLLPKEHRLEVVRISECHTAFGVILKPEGDTVRVGFLERKKKKQSPLCQKTMIVESLASIDGRSKVKTWKEGGTSLHQAYYLKLAKIHPGQIHRTPDGRIRVNYIRHCQEVPVGLNLGEPKDGAMKVGLLVARFFNRPCPGEKKFKSSYSSLNVDVPKNLRLKPQNAVSGPWKLYLSRPSQIQAQSRKGIEVDYMGGCNRSLGTVISHNDDLSPQVAVLKKHTADTCKKSTKTVSLVQPYFRIRHAKAEVRYLNLEGLMD